MLDPFKPYLHQRVEQGCGNLAQLFQEITAKGYTGSYSTVRDYLAERRPDKTPLAPAPPTVRQVTGLLTRHPATLTEDERPQLNDTLERCPALRAADEHVRAFGEMLTEQQGHKLSDWIAVVQAAELPGLTSKPRPYSARASGCAPHPRAAR
jgi:hypothetical protein